MQKEIPRLLSDYSQQFIPNKILKTFDPAKCELYKNFQRKPKIKAKDFNDYERIVAYYYELKRNFPQLVKLIIIGMTYQKRPIIVVRVSPLEGRTYDRIFIEGGMHANEWISPNSVIGFMTKLITEWDKLPDYMRKKTWLLLPLTNPDGYIFSQKKKMNRMWRKNRSNTGDPLCPGVDLNRNFSTGWPIAGDNIDPCFEDYKGKKPFSENETNAIRNFLVPQKQYLKAYIAFHSFGQEIRYLWVLKTPILEKDRIYETAKEATANIKILTKYPTKRKKKNNGAIYKVKEKPVEKSYGHTLVGLARDWARKELNISYAYTVELRDTGKKGYKIPAKFIKKTVTDVFAFLQVIAKAISDDFNKLKKKFFISQDFHELLQKQSHLFKRRPLV